VLHDDMSRNDDSHLFSKYKVLMDLEYDGIPEDNIKEDYKDEIEE